MFEKGFWSSPLYRSSFHIYHWFRKLLEKVSKKEKSHEDLLEYIRYHARENLFFFLEAIPNDANLNALCNSLEMCEFWDDLLNSTAVTDLIRKFFHNKFEHFRPQTTISSYQLIRGFYYIYLAQLTRNRERVHRSSRELRYLDSALSHHNFIALRCIANDIEQLLINAIQRTERIDLHPIIDRIATLSESALKHGAAGLLVMATLNFYFSQFYAHVTEDKKNYFKYAFKEYSYYITARELLKYCSYDVDNALLGKPLKILLLPEFQTLESAISTCKTALRECQVPESYLSMIETKAIKNASNYARSHYLEQSLSTQCVIND